MIANRQSRLLLYILVVSFMFQLGCSKSESSSSNASCSNRVAPNYSGPSEASYCSTVKSYSSAVTITGNGKYYARAIDSDGLGDPDSGNAIRYAEVVIKDNSGDIIQCGETDANGDFSLNIPSSSSKHTLYIRSRANNDYTKASVLNCPEENDYYEISKTFTPSSSSNIGEVSAPATGTLLGAAFNILDKIVASNLYLKNQVGSCPFSGCDDFTVAPKVTAYWQKGFNPNNYFGQSSGLSFYLPDESKLFILGGNNGDTDYSDTDHFDNSVIIHEYGHFLEDVFSSSDSPGGSHYGNRVIDPRLAWSEAWGNFFQAAVLNDPTYIDTAGNKDGSTSFIFKTPIEEVSSSCSSSPNQAGCDVPTSSYEGHFREFAITRFLWDIIDDASETGDDMDGSVSNVGFSEIWASIVSSSGFQNSNIAFRDVGLLNYVQLNNLTGSSTADWSNIRTDASDGLKHYQGSDRKEYGYYIDDTGSCSDFTITPYSDADDVGTFSTSNQFYNNDFYHFKHTGGTLNLTLSYETASGGSQEADLDLYIYGEGYIYGNTENMKGISEELFDNDINTAEAESISVSLPAGNYLFNVKVYTGKLPSSSSSLNGLNPGDWLPKGDTTEYNLKINGVQACPTSIP